MKEKFMNALGSFGLILYFIFTIIYAFAPLYVLDFPFLLDLLIIFVIINTNFIGGLLCLVLYVWAFVRVLTRPLDIVSVIFLVCAAIFFFGSVLPSIKKTFSKHDDY